MVTLSVRCRNAHELDISDVIALLTLDVRRCCPYCREELTVEIAAPELPALCPCAPACEDRFLTIAQDMQSCISRLEERIADCVHENEVLRQMCGFERKAT